MKRLSAVFLMADDSGKKACEIAKKAGIDFDVVILNNLNALDHAFSKPHDLLLSFGTGVIVPPRILSMQGTLALNVHAASPDYPGRDPHHFAIYDGVKKYGATIHHMMQSVDAGPIIDIELFFFFLDTTPFRLLELANDAGWRLLERFFAGYKNHGALPKIENIRWGELKFTRKMFLEMCRVDLNMSQEEITKRFKATSMPGHHNLYIDFNGYRFRIEDQKE